MRLRWCLCIACLCMACLWLLGCVTAKEASGPHGSNPGSNWAKGKASGGLDVRRLWSVSVLGEQEQSARAFHGSPPVAVRVARGMGLVVGDAIQGVGAYSLDRGKRLWFLPVPGGVAGAVSVNKVRAENADSERVFLGGGDGVFYSVDASNGRVLWKLGLGARVGRAVSSGDGARVYVQTQQGSLYALAAQTGKVLWHYARAAMVGGTRLRVYGVGVPAVLGDVVYAFFDASTSVVALNALTGELLWEKSLGDKGRSIASEVESVGRSLGVQVWRSNGEAYVLVGGVKGLYRLSLKGEVLWYLPRASAGGLGVFVEGSGEANADRAVPGGFVYSHLGGVSLVDLKTGGLVWTVPMQALPTGAVLVEGAVDGLRLCVVGDSARGVRVLDMLSGRELGAYVTGLGFWGAPFVLGRRVYALSRSAQLYAWSLHN